MNEAQERLRRLLEIINLGGHVRDDVLREAERAVYCETATVTIVT